MARVQCVKTSTKKNSTTKRTQLKHNFGIGGHSLETLGIQKRLSLERLMIFNHLIDTLLLGFI
jgi:hypothetical protein